MAFATEESLDRILNEIPEPHRLDVEAFLEEKRANGTRITTLVNQATHLRAWAQFLAPKPFQEAAKEDVRRFINQRAGFRRYRPAGGTATRPEPVRLGDGTMNIRKVVLKAFQRWLRGPTLDDRYPDEVAWLKATRRPDDDVFLDAILTRDDLLTLIQAQDNTQHRALLATLYDSGMRAGEFTSLRIRDVTIDEYGAVLTLPKGAKGLKTGARRVRVIHCTPYLVRWLNEHPRRDKPDHALWVGMSRRAPLAPLTPAGVYTLVQRAGAKADLKKPLHPHLFRHSRATEAVKEGMHEAEMRVYFGWSKASDMPSRYIHLAGADVEEGMLRRAGLKGDTKHSPSLQARACICGAKNAPTADYCEVPGCGRPLTVHAAQNREQAAFRAMLEKVDDDTLRTIYNRIVPTAIQKAQGSIPT